MLKGLLGALNQPLERLCKGQIHHRLIDIVVIAICAVIAGATDRFLNLSEQQHQGTCLVKRC
ncbi:MAG: hypothetical protein AB2989_02330 [Candidatus Symbiodolus clandestinus]